MSAASHVIPFTEREKPYTVVMSITPEIADRWLGKNIKNRHVREEVVASYARDMTSSAWKLTGESVKWSVDQVLLDGQHRLLAIAKSGKTIQTFVTFNLPTDAQEAMDTGSKRTAADALSLSDEKYSALLAGAIRLALSVQANGADHAGKYRASHAEIVAALDDNWREAVEFASTYARGTDIPSSVVAYTYWRFAQVDKHDAGRFWVAASTKVGLAPGDPVIALTARFADARRNREALSKSVQLSMIFRAWNQWRSGKPMRLLRINSATGGPVPVPDLK